MAATTATAACRSSAVTASTAAAAKRPSSFTMTEPLVHARVALSRLWALWLIPIALAVHNAEEAITFPVYLPVLRSRLPASLQPLVAAVSAGWSSSGTRVGDGDSVRGAAVGDVAASVVRCALVCAPRAGRRCRQHCVAPGGRRGRHAWLQPRTRVGRSHQRADFGVSVSACRAGALVAADWVARVVAGGVARAWAGTRRTSSVDPSGVIGRRPSDGGRRREACHPERQRGTLCEVLVAREATMTFTEGPSSLSLLGMTMLSLGMAARSSTSHC